MGSEMCIRDRCTDYSESVKIEICVVVETGESRTPRPKDLPVKYTTSLSGDLNLAIRISYRLDILIVIRLVFRALYRRSGHCILDLWRLHPLFQE